MRRMQTTLCLVGIVLAAGGCNFNGSRSDQERQQQDEKTREEVAKATERAKPDIEAAGKALNQAAQAAADEAHAAAQGIHEGWKGSGEEPVDLNSASQDELRSLPGITQRDARKIIRGRPYHGKRDLVTKGILSESAYAAIRDDVTTK